MSVASEPASGKVHPANTIGLDYRDQAARFEYTGPIWDVHTHLNDLEAARIYFAAAELFGVERVWTMTPLPLAPAIKQAFGDRVELIAVPNYADRDKPETFTTQWLSAIESFAALGCRVCKFWAAPRGRDLHESLTLDSPIRHEARRLAHSLGMTFMVHVADPDTWFATKYADASRYGTKRQQYEPLERMLEAYADTVTIAAHMGGYPEDLVFLQGLLDRHPNLVVDTSATKWMVRELSRHPDAFRAFCERNRGRVLFGTDIVAAADNRDFTLYASRFWALRTLIETGYDGPSPIVDPDLHLVDPTVPEMSSPALRGARLEGDALADVYHRAARRVLSPAA